MRNEILRMDHIVCKEAGVPALNHFTMQIFEGEIYGVVNLEQSGIETIIDLICHNRELEYGQIFMYERQINRVGNSNGAKNKVEVIGTHSHLIDTMSLADNLFVVRKGLHPQIISRKKLLHQTQQLLDEMCLSIKPWQKIEEMNTLERFTAEVLKAIVRGNKLIILYDISDVFSSEELPVFHAFLRRLADKGSSFLYIYRHHEVLRQICDRIGVFQDGAMQKVYWDLQDMKNDARIFAGSLYQNVFELNMKKGGKKSSRVPVLKWHKGDAPGSPDINLTLYSGEIVLLLDRSNTVLQEIIEKMKLYKGCRIGIADKNPLESMLFPEMSYLDNLCFMLGEKVPLFWQKRTLKKHVRREYYEEIGSVLDEKQLYNVSVKDLYTLVYYRYLISRPELFVCLQPLSGLDIHMRTYVLELLSRFSENGIAVLILSTELYDTLYISDRLIQMEHGKIIEDIPQEEFENTRNKKAEIFPD